MAITRDEAARRFFYDPEVGMLFHRERDRAEFKSEADFRRHLLFVGKPVGKNATGYVTVEINGKTVPAHRIIWIIANGEIPCGMMIDHINGVRNDNRIGNLRLADAAINSRNKFNKSNNSSGYPGVDYVKRYDRYRARINVGGHEIHLGHFREKNDAILARMEAEREHGFITRMSA